MVFKRLSKGNDRTKNSQNRDARGNMYHDPAPDAEYKLNLTLNQDEVSVSWSVALQKKIKRLAKFTNPRPSFDPCILKNPYFEKL